MPERVVYVLSCPATDIITVEEFVIRVLNFRKITNELVDDFHHGIEKKKKGKEKKRISEITHVIHGCNITNKSESENCGVLCECFVLNV